MGRTGNCCDDALAESFFNNLKNKLTDHERFRDRDATRAAIFDYIEVPDNQQR